MPELPKDLNSSYTFHKALSGAGSGVLWGAFTGAATGSIIPLSIAGLIIGAIAGVGSAATKIAENQEKTLNNPKAEL
jgi:hypothetical protein